MECLPAHNTLVWEALSGEGDDRMEFVILGRTALRVDGRTVPLGAAKQRAMLALLLYHVGEPVRVDTLVEYLWPDRRPQECRDILYPLASRTRAVLSRVGIACALDRVPSISGYRLNVDPLTIDFHRFRRMAADARWAASRGSFDTAASLLNVAIELWQDEPLADLRGPRADHLRRFVNDSLLDAHRQLIDCELRLGRHESALVRLEPLVRAHELDESFAQSWITALCHVGRPGDARRFLGEFRRRFRSEMRADPAVTLPDPAVALPAPAETIVGSAPPKPVGPRQLPKDITDFTGHDELLARLDELTAAPDRRANIVVISGMPGVGKTTLATHWAHLRRDRFPDGQLYLNAQAYGPMPAVDPDDALGRFLQALDVPVDRIPLSGDDRRDRLNRLLAGRRMLILLDNVHDSRQVRPLLTTADSCLTLITSRSRLKGLSIREAVPNLTVPPLAEDAGRALLDRVIGVSRTSGEPDAVRSLVRACGGLPLALRIVSVHVAERPRARVADLVDELSLHLLDGEGEDDENSVRTLFDWSFAALSPDAARLFRLLGLYPGATIGVEAAAALAGFPVQRAEPLLNGLAKMHLINHDTARRYRFHDLLRRYAADRAEAEEPAEQRREAIGRLLTWYVLTAANATAVLAPHRPPVPDLPSPADICPQTFETDPEALRWCEAERSNMVAVTRWAADHGLHRLAWQLAGAAYEVFNRYGRQDDMLELLRLALSSARRDRHQQGQLGILNNLGTTYYLLHDYRRAAEELTTGLGLARSIGFVEAELTYLHNLATVHLKVGDTAAAIEIYERVLAARVVDGEPGAQAYAMHRLGDAYRRIGGYNAALAQYRRALEIFEQIGSLRGQGAVNAELAALFLECSQPEEAQEYCQRALDFHRRTRDEAALCDTLITAADAQRELGRGPDAVRDAQRAVALGMELADSPRRGRALVALSHALAATGRIADATEVSRQALAIVDELNDPEAGSLRERLLALRESLPPVDEL